MPAADDKSEREEALRALFGGAVAVAWMALAILIILAGFALISHAHANPSPADMGLDKSATTGNLSVLDRSGAWVAVGSVNSTTHALAIPNSSLANTATTVGGSSCALGGSCSPSTTIGGTACGLGGSCAPAVTVNGTTCTLGSTCAPTSAATLTIGTSPTSGGAAGQLMFDTGSVLTESAALVFTSPTLKIVSNTGALALGTAADTILTRDAANAFGQRNGTTAQLFSVYNSFTSATSYERAVFDWQTTAGVLNIGTEKGSGGGSPRNLEFVVGGVNKADFGVTQAGAWSFNTTMLTTGISASGGITAAGTISGLGSVGASGLLSGGSIFSGSTIESSSNIFADTGNITAKAGSVVAGTTAATVTSGQIAYGGSVVASSSCGSLSGAAGCVQINIAGTNHFVPYY